VPRDGFAVTGRCDEPVYRRRIVELLRFTISVDLRRTGFGELTEESLDALKEVLGSSVAAQFGANALRRIGVDVLNINGHRNDSFQLVEDL
jgi:hypothetical protein